MASTPLTTLPAPAFRPIESIGKAHLLNTTHDMQLPQTAVLDPEEVLRLLPHHLPGELFNNIFSLVWETSFLTGFILIQRAPDEHQNITLPKTYLWQGTVYNFAKPALLYLNHMLLRTYEKRMWSENTVVIGTGPKEDTTDYFQTTPFEAFRWVRKVHIKFPIKDLYWPREFPGFVKLNPDCDQERYAECVEQQNGELKEMWHEKLFAVRCMDLEEVVLDFTEAFRVQGGFLGKGLAKSLWWQTFPRKITVLAPDGDKRRKILRDLRVGNTFV